MKVLFFVACLCIVSTSFATEVGTECSAMSENREKNLKEVKPKTNSKKGVRAQ